MKPLRFSYNSAFNIAESLASSLTLFVLYRLVLVQTGISSLGIWSLVFAATAIGRFADVGAAGGLSRLIALRVSPESAVVSRMDYLISALYFNLFVYSLVGAAIYLPAIYSLRVVLRGKDLLLAQHLLPFAIASFSLSNIANVPSAALTGVGRSYLKSAIVICSLVVQVFITMCFVHRLGLFAMAFAQIVQYIVIAVVALAASVRIITGDFDISGHMRLNFAAMRRLIGFGSRLQLLNILSFPFEPIIKFMFTAHGGVAALGLYELASRGILQVRQVIISPSQNLTPIFATTYEASRKELDTVYAAAAAKMSIGSVILILFAVFSPLVSLIWFRRINPDFIYFSILLCIGWSINVLSVPGYFLGIGCGKLRWNILGAFTTIFITLASASVFGSLLGGFGVALSGMVAISAGSILSAKLNCKMLNIRLFPSPRELANTYRSLVFVATR